MRATTPIMTCESKANSSVFTRLVISRMPQILAHSQPSSSLRRELRARRRSEPEASSAGHGPGAQLRTRRKLRGGGASRPLDARREGKPSPRQVSPAGLPRGALRLAHICLVILGALSAPLEACGRHRRSDGSC